MNFLVQGFGTEQHRLRSSFRLALLLPFIAPFGPTELLFLIEWIANFA